MALGSTRESGGDEVPIKLSLEGLRAICVEDALEGNSLDELCAELGAHAISVHNWDASKCDDLDERPKFRGAIKQTARPDGIRGLDLEV
jgi:hypothetical protein